MVTQKEIGHELTRVIFHVCLQSLNEEREANVGPVCIRVSKNELICRDELSLNELNLFLVSLGYIMKELIGTENFDETEPTSWMLESQKGGEIIVATKILLPSSFVE